MQNSPYADRFSTVVSGLTFPFAALSFFAWLSFFRSESESLTRPHSCRQLPSQFSANMSCMGSGSDKCRWIILRRVMSANQPPKKWITHGRFGWSKQNIPRVSLSMGSCGARLCEDDVDAAAMPSKHVHQCLFPMYVVKAVAYRQQSAALTVGKSLQFKAVFERCAGIGIYECS